MGAKLAASTIEHFAGFVLPKTEATRFRVLHIYDHDNTKTVIAFLQEVREHFPFAIQRIQTDNSSSFGPQFTWHLSDLRISHKHIPPGCPEVNGKVERSHKTDSQEFYQGRHFKHKRGLARKLKKWETEYNEDRPYPHTHTHMVTARSNCDGGNTSASFTLFMRAFVFCGPWSLRRFLAKISELRSS